MADYSESHRVQEKVEVLIYALDLLLDIVFDQILAPTEKENSTNTWITRMN